MLFDAHLHLQDPRLGDPDPILATLHLLDVDKIVVNGTSPADWAAVAGLARLHPNTVIPSFGLHPWRLAPAPPDGWYARLEALLHAHPAAGIGEVGLDRWVEGHHLPTQIDALRPQIALAAQLDRPLSIHCLRAFGTLLDLLRASHLPARGFLLHSYSGPADLLPSFAELGAYFSFSGHFLHPRKSAQRATFKLVPHDRLLIETDAPDMLPPPTFTTHHLAHDPTLPSPPNHPANIASIYRGAADALEIPLHHLIDLAAENFARLFPSP